MTYINVLDIKEEKDIELLIFLCRSIVVNKKFYDKDLKSIKEEKGIEGLKTFLVSEIQEALLKRVSFSHLNFIFQKDLEDGGYGRAFINRENIKTAIQTDSGSRDIDNAGFPIGINREYKSRYESYVIDTLKDCLSSFLEKYTFEGDILTKSETLYTEEEKRHIRKGIFILEKNPEEYKDTQILNELNFFLETKESGERFDIRMSKLKEEFEEEDHYFYKTEVRKNNKVIFYNELFHGSECIFVRIGDYHHFTVNSHYCTEGRDLPLYIDLKEF